MMERRMLDQEREDFIKRWKSDPELREQVFTVCRYYSCPRVGNYFVWLTYKILKEGYIPTLKEYKKLCKNKYARRVIREHEKEPRYPVNSFVQVRKSNKTNYFSDENNNYRMLDGIYAVVLQTDALPIRRAAKGAKVYKILPVGANRAYYVHESDIKIARGMDK